MALNQVQKEILSLKKENDVTILAHYYQRIEIQEIADNIGDSLGLARIAKERSNTPYILFAGVKFMAETASIINQEKKVLIPNPESYCPLAAFLTAEMVREYKQKHPSIPVVTYVNSTAAVKAESDVCCTSSNSTKIVKKVMKEFNTDTVLFGPDANLADHVEQQLGVKLIKMPENGHCIVHTVLTKKDVEEIRRVYPNAELIVHPECIREIKEAADFIGSTSQMYAHVKKNPNNVNEFIVGTEQGLLERLALDFPEKKFYLAHKKMICYNMKKHTIELVKYVLEHLDDDTYEVKVPPKIAEKAVLPINKMLEYS
ncbi:MAG: quinolinate synthase NadA [Promethearchaeota archaeon]